MRYEEKSPNLIISIIVLVISFIVFYCYYPSYNLGWRELLGSEGKYAAMALDMNILNPSTVAQGETLSYYYPLYPWLVSILYKLGVGLEVGLRGISVLAVAGIGVIIFETCRRISGVQAAIVATGFSIANVIIFQKATDGNPFTLGVLLLLVAWLMWYMFGAMRGDWNAAWVVSLFFCGLAFYTIGWLSILYFFIPLIFMRRPLTLWNKFQTKGFYVGGCILVFFILLWMIPRLTSIVNNPFNSFNIFQNINPKGLFDFFMYPLAIAGGLLPWTIIAWAPFCVAYFPLDEKPIFSRFLRTIFLSLFVFLWINPFAEARDALILIPSIAILSGTNYWLVVRRNGYELHKLLNIMTIILLFIASVILILYLVPPVWWKDLSFLKWIHKSFLIKGISFFNTLYLFGVIQSGIGIVLGILLLVFYKKKLTVWGHALGVCIIFMLCFWSVTYPYNALSDEGRVTAKAIISSLGKDYSQSMTIYKSSEISNIYALGCYLGCHIKKINNLNDLPENASKVYLLTINPPIFPGRKWDIISKVKYRDNILYLWEGIVD